MNEINIETFERAVRQYFEPIAREHGWPLTRRAVRVYEVPSPHFVLRIRFDVGSHQKTINALLIPNNEMPGDIENGDYGELGVAVIAGYNGLKIEYIPRDNSEKGLFEEAQYRANLLKEFGLPYMLGERSDWDKVKEYINAECDERAEEIRKMRFPSFVQKRWHLPPPPPDTLNDT